MAAIDAIAGPGAPLASDGLLAVRRERESFWVRPGGATAVALRGDDRVELVDPQGGRAVEVTLIDHAGVEAFDALGLAPDGPAGLLRALAGSDGGAFARTLHAGGADLHAARSARLTLDPVFAAVAARDAVLVVAAPETDEPDAPDLLLQLHRAAPAVREEAELPPPLAEPRLELRVDAATARDYTVQAGEYIQIIDVAGRQCSDFVAFSRGKLEDGIERGLDATATRSMTGRAYPEPGLRGKFFDTDLLPLVEVVQDTVGRHDTFALACTARYYEDLGYPGHVNCTDNFNGVLAPWGIAPRGGWPALNLFYNTAFDASHLLVGDEPWSRPGDHVLLRALDDLVCASSACPDDIDPSNGWEVTDVHVRVYRPEHRFSVAIAHRPDIELPPRMTTDSAFGPRVRALGADMTDGGGFWLPERFHGHGATAEYLACRERVAVMDLSQLRKWEVVGSDAETLIQRTITRDARRIAVGQVSYTAVCDETGAMVDDATVFRLGQDNWRFVGGCDTDELLLRETAERHGLERVWIKAATDDLHNLAVQGPRSRDLLTSIVWSSPTQPDLADLRWFRFLVGRIGGPQGVPVVVSRTGYTGELGYEVFCHPRDGEAVWDAVLEAGADHGIAPLGLDALELLRVEAGLILAGHEFGNGEDPYEAGIGFTVALDGEDFTGRDALIERRDHPREQLVGLLLDGGEAPAHGDAVLAGRREVGVITSAVVSPHRRAPVALGRVAVQHADDGAALTVQRAEGRRRTLDATVTAVPFYDPDKRRPRA